MAQAANTAALLEQHFDTAFAASDGIKKLRELILTLAMQGKLVPQDPNDPSASELLKEIEAEKQRLVKEGKIKKPKSLPPVTEKEKPYALPQGWEWVRLGEIGIWKSGSTPSRTNSNYYGGNIPWVKSGEVKQGRITQTDESITELALNECSISLNPKGSVLVAMYGANIGEVGILDIEATTNQAICACRTYAEFDERYLLSLISSLKPYFISQGAGAAQPNISREKIVATPFPLPPLPEQHRIVAKIDELMARCDELEQLHRTQQDKRLTVHTAAVQQLLNIAKPQQHQRAQQFLAEHFGALYTVKENVAELRKAILQLAVMGKLVPQDSNDQPTSELLKEIEAEKQRLAKEGKIKAPKPLPPIKPAEVLYELPQGWKWMRLGELGITQTGTTPPSKDRENYGDHIPFIGPGDIKGGSISYSGDGLSEQGLASGRLIDANSILMVCIGGSIGKHAIAGRDIACNQQINTLTPYKQISEKYIFYVMGGPIFQNAVFSQAGGSATPIINKQKWSAIPVPIPPAHEQYRIVARIDQLMALCDALDQQIDAATAKQTELLCAVMAQV